jgi:hypothetical protein
MTNRQTVLKVKNISDSSIIAWLTLFDEEAMVDNVNGVFGIKSDFDLQGNFVLHKGDEIEYQSRIRFGISGSICFGSKPVDYPTKQFKNGVNTFEFTINNYANAKIKKINDAKEAVGISCVKGINSLMKVDLITNNKWNASNNFEDVKSFSNSNIKVDNSIYRVQRDCKNCGGIIQLNFLGLIT